MIITLSELITKKGLYLKGNPKWSGYIEAEISAIKAAEKRIKYLESMLFSSEEKRIQANSFILGLMKQEEELHTQLSILIKNEYENQNKKFTGATTRGHSEGGESNNKKRANCGNAGSFPLSRKKREN